MNQIIQQLKNDGQDYEFYPSTPEMFAAVWNHVQARHFREISVLDIGAGNCGLYNYIQENRGSCDKIQYYVIEKSKRLLEIALKEAICLGVDFHESTLMDKEVSFVFCNPPYSEFVEWTLRIISEANTFDVYLIIPQRWKENRDIAKLLKELNAKVQVLESLDFTDADRVSRAKVDVLHISKANRNEFNPFSRWFDANMVTAELKVETELEKKERIDTAVKLSKSPVDTLVDLFNDEQAKLIDHFRKICSMDAEILRQLNVCKETIKEALLKNMQGLKVLYWNLAMENLEEITSRLTSGSRQLLMEKFKQGLSAEFTKDNIYIFVIWVIRHAEGHIEKQIIKFYEELSSEENVRPYKSNQSTFRKDKWRYLNPENGMKWTLDYRIVCNHNILKVYHYDAVVNPFQTDAKILDLKTICRNLGFTITRYDHPANLDFGQKGYFYMQDGDQEVEALEYKFYKNRNVHLKFNQKIIMAINVQAGKLMGWLVLREDIKKEFDPEHAKGAEAYFDIPLKLTGQKLNILK